MAFINTSRKIGVSINGRDYTSNLISGSISDDSSLNTSIIKTSGTITLGGAHGGTHVDLFGRKLPVGSRVNITTSVAGSGGYGAIHPRGHLYVISSSTDLQSQTTTVEVGCILQLISSYEQAFSDRVYDLFWLVEDSLKYFVINDYSLATLDSILQTLGKSIFQCSGGGIHLLDIPVGLNSQAGGGGFTSIDQQTAIEMTTFTDVASSDDPLSLSIALSFDIPKNPKEEEPETLDNQEEEPVEEDDGNGEGDGEEEEPIPDEVNEVLSDINYVKTRKLKLKPFNECLKVYKGKKILIELDDAKSIRSCGKYLNPNYVVTDEELEEWISDPDPCSEAIEADEFVKESRPYSYAVEGDLEVDEVFFSDYVETFAVTSYQGPGNQADLDWTWESQSAWVYADQVVSQWFDFMRQEFSAVTSEANSWMEQANEYFELRDENNVYILTEQEKLCLVENSTLSEILTMKRNYAFYDCAGVNAILNAENLIDYAKTIYNEVVDRFNSLNGRRSFTNFNTRKTTFGPGGEVIRRVSKQIVHKASSHLAKDYLDKFAKIFDEQEEDFYATVIDRTKELPDFGRYRFEPLFSDPSVNVYYSNTDAPLTKIIRPAGNNKKQIIYNKSGVYEREPLDNGRISDGLVATSQVIEEYEYLTKRGTPLIKETVTTVDYANKNNNSKAIKISTDYSTAAASERLNANASEAEGVEGEEEGADEQQGLDSQDDNPCEVDTETREVIYKIARATPILGPGSAAETALSLYDEQISLPAQLRPLVPQRLDIGQVLTAEDCNSLTAESITEAEQRLSEYEKIVNRYLIFEMSKRLGDNRGFRVTESLRPELYNYHPYMNITMISQTNGFSCTGMVSSSNWVFDSSNALCSFDCYVFGYNEGVPFGDATKVSLQTPLEIPRGDFVVITLEMLEIGTTIEKVVLQEIENPYYKYYLDDVELVDSGLEVYVIDIVNGRLRLYNFTPEEEPEVIP